MITEQILRTADRLPAKAAIVFNGEAIDYRTFATAIRTTTGYLRRRAVAGGGIAVIADTGLDVFWVWSLALRRLGLTVVPVASTADLAALPLAGIRFVLTRADGQWSDLTEVCRANSWALHPVDMGREAPVPVDVAPPFLPGGQILRTSGTTGRLKAVLIEPSSEDMYADERGGLMGLGEGTTCTVFRMAPWTGVGYKVPVNVWATGGTVIIDQRDDIAAALRVPGATHAILTPHMLDAILSAPEEAFPRQETLLLCVTGGSITQAQVAEARRRITPNLFNMLATTEIGIFGFTPFGAPADHRWHRPLPGSVVEVVDADDRPAPPGVTGRLRVANPAEARYYSDEDANRAFFRDGYFYPGDLAERDPDGRIALQGRTTDVINVRGSKIAPAALERQLSALCDEREICLFSRQDERGEERLFCVVEGTAPVDGAALAALVERELGTGELLVRHVAAMDRTDSGKVIRQRLRERLAV